MKSDFGADVFDDDEPPPKPATHAEESAEPRGKEFRAQEIELDRRSRRDDAAETDVSFPAGAQRAPEERAQRAAPERHREERPSSERAPRRHRDDDDEAGAERHPRHGGHGRPRMEAAPERERERGMREAEVREERRPMRTEGRERGRDSERGDTGSAWRSDRGQRGPREEPRRDPQRRHEHAGQARDAGRGDASAREGGPRGRERHRDRRDESRRDADVAASTPHAAREMQADAARAGDAGQVVGSRIAIFLDVGELQSQARRQGSEVSYLRLLRELAADRQVVRSVAYVLASDRGLEATLTTHGLEVERCESAEEVAVAIAVDAIALAAKVDCVVLAPATLAIGPLARAMRARGLRVESASFEERRPWPGQPHHVLGRGCLFVP